MRARQVSVDSVCFAIDPRAQASEPHPQLAQFGVVPLRFQYFVPGLLLQQVVRSVPVAAFSRPESLRQYARHTSS
jgi:hypothetical protein